MGKKWNQDANRFKKILDEDQQDSKPKFYNKKPVQKTITGNIASLGSHVFYLGGSVEKSGYHFQLTVNKIAEYVQTEYGGDMWTLITTQTECRPTEPEEPRVTRGAAASWEVDKYKLKYSQYLKKEEQYDRDKAKTFAVVYGQATTGMKNRLRSYTDHADMSRNANVTKLLDRLKKLMLREDTDQDEFCAILLSMMKLIRCSQGSKELLDGFYLRWNTQVEVLETKWGPFAPSKNTSVADQDRFKARMFLHSLDPHRYGKILTHLHNSFVMGNKKVYPETPDEAYKMAKHWKHEDNKKNFSESAVSKLAFAQIIDDESADPYIETNGEEQEELNEEPTIKSQPKGTKDQSQEPESQEPEYQDHGMGMWQF